LGLHKRSIQRRCKASKLPGAYQVGRSWRIPPSALRAAELDRAFGRDDVERELRAATLVCRTLAAEIEEGKLPRRAPVASNWLRIARELERLHEALERLPARPSEVPGWLADRSAA
ncbi:MAG: helix-turn-helix domain-containing protein, partial [Actinomycetota bacterium]|nr:helix-turn-helix domain-containing protein [Actinomycetota bacterium]